MTASVHSSETENAKSADYEVLIVGAGVTGLYQLHRAREHRWSVRLLEAGSGVGGTWYWNRYPAARTDSEAYTYGYFTPKELLAEWNWTEHFASQPELEAYFNKFVNDYDLRRDIEFDARVVSAVYSEVGSLWTVTTSNGKKFTATYLIAASGVLSVPFYPSFPGTDTFRGLTCHTATWPRDGVDLAGKRVALIGTGSSGVQLVPAIIDEVQSLTVYQRTPNWAMPLNNCALSAAEQEEIRSGYPALYERLQRTSGGFLHEDATKNAFDDTVEARRAHYEDLWNGRGMRAMFSTYADVLTNPAANADFSEFVAQKIRSIVKDPETADKLIPKDHGFGMKRPPLETGYYEAYNKPNIELVDLRENPILRFTTTGIESADTTREFDVIIYATGFDAFTGALTRMGIRGLNGVSLEKYWAEGPFTYLGVAVPGFPNLLIDSGPHGTFGNIPRSAEVQVDFVTGLVNHARSNGFNLIDAAEAAAEDWTAHVYEGAQHFAQSAGSWYVGGNIPGKAKKFLPYSWGIPIYREKLNEVANNGYRGFRFAHVAAEAAVS